MIQKLIIGLGNPGQKFTFSRHNVGFLIVDAFACKCKANFNIKKYKSLSLVIDESIMIVKPQTFMNLSGEAVKTLAIHYSVAPKDILVISDDINLPFGRLRVRPEGSHGGHNGLLSIISELNTDSFPRLRVGIGNEKLNIDLKKYVLMNFTENEMDDLEKKIIPAVVEAIDVFINNGIMSAMNKYNGLNLMGS